MTDARKLARIFQVLSVDTRVRMILLLQNRSLCVNALAAKLNITPAAASQHLRIMRAAELVTAEKRGYFVHYELNSRTLGRWREWTRTLWGATD